MKEFIFTINDPIGIHARPAGLLVRASGAFDCKISIKKGDKCADAKKIFSIMSLGVKQGDTVTVTAEGNSEDSAIEALQSFFSENL